MKKILVVLMSLVLLVCSSSILSYATTSIPTSEWDLRPTAYMEQIGIFTDPVNHRGYYPYSAYIGGNYTMYSSYYFRAQANKHFYLCGYEYTSINQEYKVVLQNKFNNGYDRRTVYASETFFVFDYGNGDASLSNLAYFYFEPTNGLNVSINGTIETYY